MKPLYGLAESGDYLNETLTKHHIEHLRMQQANGDFSLFMYHVGKKLSGLSGTYVDDILRTGDEKLKRNSMKTTKRAFESKSPRFNKFAFTGISLKGGKGLRELSQKEYINRLRYLQKSAKFEDFRSMRHKLAWTVHTRPDIACAVSKLAQVTERELTQSCIERANKIIKHLKSTPNISLKFPKLDVNTLRLNVYCDSSFTNNDD